MLVTVNEKDVVVKAVAEVVAIAVGMAMAGAVAVMIQDNKPFGHKE